MSAEIPSSHRALVVGPNKNWVIRNQALPQYDDLLVKVAFVSLNPTVSTFYSFRKKKKSPI